MIRPLGYGLFLGISDLARKDPSQNGARDMTNMICVGYDFAMLWGHLLNLPPIMKVCDKEPDIAHRREGVNIKVRSSGTSEECLER